MIRRLFLLNGLAIIAVVANHAAGWGFNAMFWWTDRYWPGVVIPNYDQVGTISYYILVAIQKLANFSVPAFLFVSGFFVAYAARGVQSGLSWQVVRTRVTNLLVPYLIWSLVIFLMNWLESCLDTCQLESLGSYLTKLALGGASEVYWYVILICQLFLLAPFLVPVAKTKWQWLLIVTALIQLFTLTLMYLHYAGLTVPYIETINGWFLGHIFYFSFGIVTGFHLPLVSGWLVRVKWGLLVAVIIFGILAVVEDEFLLYPLTSNRASHFSLSTTLYALAFILAFLAFQEWAVPYSKTIYQLGSKAYGLYLLHPLILLYGSKIIYHVTPQLLAFESMYQPFLIGVGIGLPFLLMWWVSQSPLRGTYRYLFG